MLTLEFLLTQLLWILVSKTTIETNTLFLNELLTSGGMSGMLDTIWLVICAMIFGGVMDQ